MIRFRQRQNLYHCSSELDQQVDRQRFFFCICFCAHTPDGLHTWSCIYHWNPTVASKVLDSQTSQGSLDPVSQKPSAISNPKCIYRQTGYVSIKSRDDGDQDCIRPIQRGQFLFSLKPLCLSGNAGSISSAILIFIKKLDFRLLCKILYQILTTKSMFKHYISKREYTYSLGHVF